MSTSDFEKPNRRVLADTKNMNPQKRKAIIIKLPPEQIKALKQLALDRDSTMQDVVSQEITKMLKRNKRG